MKLVNLLVSAALELIKKEATGGESNVITFQKFLESITPVSPALPFNFFTVVEVGSGMITQPIAKVGIDITLSPLANVN